MSTETLEKHDKEINIKNSSNVINLNERIIEYKFKERVRIINNILDYAKLLDW
jgi:hypothetical protein